jgi:hypothetical protein
MRTASAITEGINRRFFIALSELIRLKRLSSLSSFCREFNLSSSRYREIRLTYGLSPKPDYQSRYKCIEFDALCSLCCVYSVSADWLFLGRGKMFGENEKDDKI